MGCVYILVNPAMPGLIKIGYTTRAAEVRANELYDGAFGVPKPFVVVYTNDCEDPPKLEAIVHKQLAQYRINNNREFFEYPADDAYQLVKDLHKESQQEHKPLFSRKNIKGLSSGIMGSIIGSAIFKVLSSFLKSILNLFRGHH